MQSLNLQTTSAENKGEPEGFFSINSNRNAVTFKAKKKTENGLEFFTPLMKYSCHEFLLKCRLCFHKAYPSQIFSSNSK